MDQGSTDNTAKRNRPLLFIKNYLISWERKTKLRLTIMRVTNAGIERWCSEVWVKGDTIKQMLLQQRKWRLMIEPEGGLCSLKMANRFYLKPWTANSHTRTYSCKQHNIICFLLISFSFNSIVTIVTVLCDAESCRWLLFKFAMWNSVTFSFVSFVKKTC